MSDEYDLAMQGERKDIAKELERLASELAEAQRERDEWRQKFLTESKQLGYSRDLSSVEKEYRHDLMEDLTSVALKFSDAMDLLKKHGIHIEETWCWCNPIVESHAVSNTVGETGVKP